MPLRKMRRSERLLLPLPYCSIFACVNGQSSRMANSASAQDLTSPQKATSYQRDPEFPFFEFEDAVDCTTGRGSDRVL